jgi:formylglycine-generating enzyme required for sulfatase activity
MGNPEPEQFGQYSRCEGPQHRVRIRQPFLMSKFEITVRQFRTFAESTGYQTDAERSGEGVNGLDVQSGQVVQRPQCIWTNPGFEQQDDHPVVCVSWHDAAAFCRWLTQQTGRNCRLPTEAEWEYCCRGRSQTTYFTGDDAELLKTAANCGDQSLTEVCSAASSTANWNDTFAFTAPVGSFSANAFGLHDMHGNVGEWCQDWFDATYYTEAEVDDPTGPERPTQWRVVRGGSWYNAPASCRSSGRHDGIATAASTTNGFRIVVEQVE